MKINKLTITFIVATLICICGFSYVSIIHGYYWPNDPDSIRLNRQYRITATLGEYRENDRYHAGIDIGAPVGSAIYPVFAGVVTDIRRDGDFAYVFVRGNGRTCRYFHIRTT